MVRDIVVFMKCFVVPEEIDVIIETVGVIIVIVVVVIIVVIVVVVDYIGGGVGGD